MVSELLINTGFVIIDMLSDSTKPSSEPMLTHSLYNQQDPLAFIHG